MSKKPSKFQKGTMRNAYKNVTVDKNLLKVKNITSEQPTQWAKTCSKSAKNSVREVIGLCAFSNAIFLTDICPLGTHEYCFDVILQTLNRFRPHGLKSHKLICK